MAAHLHILGICGTFMGGIAAIAKAAGYRVTGCDANVYPPMSEQLEALGIELAEGFGAEQIAQRPDLWVIGNVVTRGNPLMEAILDRGERYVSGPQWLAENVLAGRHVLAVAGTHGKTTVSAMLAWMLERSARDPGFLIGGVPLEELLLLWLAGVALRLTILAVPGTRGRSRSAASERNASRFVGSAGLYTTETCSRESFTWLLRSSAAPFETTAI